MRNVDEIFKITVNLYLNISYYYILLGMFYASRNETGQFLLKKTQQ